MFGCGGERKDENDNENGKDGASKEKMMSNMANGQERTTWSNKVQQNNNSKK